MTQNVPECLDNNYTLFVFFFCQGKSQDAALQNMLTLYWPVLKANWTYLSLLVFINIKFVPPIVSLPIIGYQFLISIDFLSIISTIQFSFHLGSSACLLAISLDSDGWFFWPWNVASCKTNWIQSTRRASL